MKIKVQIIHRTGRKTSLVAIEWPKEYSEMNIFKVGEGHYASVPKDSIEIITLKAIKGGDVDDV